MRLAAVLCGACLVAPAALGCNQSWGAGEDPAHEFFEVATLFRAGAAAKD